MYFCFRRLWHLFLIAKLASCINLFKMRFYLNFFFIDFLIQSKIIIYIKLLKIASFLNFINIIIIIRAMILIALHMILFKIFIIKCIDRIGSLWCTLSFSIDYSVIPNFFWVLILSRNYCTIRITLIFIVK